MSNKKATKLENKVADDIEGGKRQIASGALPFWKHDIKSDMWLVEHKYKEPETKSFSVKKLDFKNLTTEAFKLGKLPAMVIEFLGRPEVKVVVIRYEEWLELDKAISKEDNV